MSLRVSSLRGFSLLYAQSPIRVTDCQCLLIIRIQILIYQPGDKVCAKCTREPIHPFPGYSGLSVPRAKHSNIRLSEHSELRSSPLTKAISFQLEYLTAGSCVHQSASAESMMSGSMSAKLTVQGFPTTQFLHCHITALTSGKDSGIGPEAM